MFPSLLTLPLKFHQKTIILYQLCKSFYKSKFNLKTINKSFSAKQLILCYLPQKQKNYLYKEISAFLHMKNRVNHFHISTIYLPFNIMEDNLLIISCKGKSRHLTIPEKVVPFILQFSMLKISGKTNEQSQCVNKIKTAN